ncbi:PEP-CTERM sorting domain-containing protein [Pseudoluteimonas lycopersici]|uniref:PEP-CTERM sorting domain-containing protein n=1 Tax=Pseudoluteimonas lycopersici TaxID=1324796 RepID=A0A516V5L5_9GAMM|nr:PEP-CTERM sorting domain-containing protein [Lysobacter lycopersici]
MRPCRAPTQGSGPYCGHRVGQCANRRGIARTKSRIRRNATPGKPEPGTGPGFGFGFERWANFSRRRRAIRTSGWLRRPGARCR